jgi:BirA family biotin operon repressor/biotin-[acetyl-CoA-carboxylase] ligase
MADVLIEYLYSLKLFQSCLMIGSSIITLRETTSTNNYALQLISDSRPLEGTIIRGIFQTNGKGMETNTWESEDGKNLTFTIILYPAFLPADKQFIINQSVAIGVAEFVKKILPKKVITIKWPNDIYVDDKKIGGILIQNSIMGQTFDYMIVGIGLNINQEKFHSPAPNPVSIKMITGTEYDLDEMLNLLCSTINLQYTRVIEGNIDQINKLYLEQLYRINEWHHYLIRGEYVNARITGLGSYGQLLLEGENGQHWVCDIKEVKYL